MGGMGRGAAVADLCGAAVAHLSSGPHRAF
jgi:hypothetical protein